MGVPGSAGKPLPLPRGRGSLPGEATAFMQRARILDATAHVVARDGFAGASVADIHERAGVSRRSFYDHFSGKEDAVLRAFDAAAAFAVPLVQRALHGGDGWEHGLGAALGTYLALLDCDRSWTILCQVELAGTGASGLRRRTAASGPVLRALQDRQSGGGRAAAPAPEALLAAVDTIVAQRLDGTGRLWLDREAIARAAVGADLAERMRDGLAGARVDTSPARALEIAALLADPDGPPVGRLRDLVREAAAHRDGPALGQAVVGLRRAGLADGPARDVDAIALGALERASVFGLPLREAGAGAGAWSVAPLAQRCRAYVEAHPGAGSADIRAALGVRHLAQVNRVLARLERAGVVRRVAGPRGASEWHPATPKRR